MIPAAVESGVAEIVAGTGAGAPPLRPVRRAGRLPGRCRSLSGVPARPSRATARAFETHGLCLLLSTRSASHSMAPGQSISRWASLSGDSGGKSSMCAAAPSLSAVTFSAAAGSACLRRFAMAREATPGHVPLDRGEDRRIFLENRFEKSIQGADCDDHLNRMLSGFIGGYARSLHSCR
jgi:hypothetical protein